VDSEKGSAPSESSVQNRCASTAGARTSTTSQEPMRASASVMNLPSLVLPYQRSPSRWKTLVFVCTRTMPLAGDVPASVSAGFAFSGTVAFRLAAGAEPEGGVAAVDGWSGPALTMSVIFSRSTATAARAAACPIPRPLTMPRPRGQDHRRNQSEPGSVCQPPEGEPWVRAASALRTPNGNALLRSATRPSGSCRVSYRNRAGAPPWSLSPETRSRRFGSSRFPGSAGRAWRGRSYHHLSDVVLDVPPLRARRDDIPLLIEHFRFLFNGKDDLTSAFAATVMTPSRLKGSRVRRWPCSRRIPGREMCASWNGSYTGPWPSDVVGWCGRRT
jgi:hypothetical protein